MSDIITIWLGFTLIPKLLEFNRIISEAYGQSNENYSQIAKAKVDKLMENITRDNAIDKAYKAELIIRTQNTTCLTEATERLKEGFPEFNLNYLTTQELVDTLKQCVADGKIK